MATLTDFVSTPRPPVRIFPPDAFFYRRVTDLPLHPQSAQVIAELATLCPSGVRPPRGRGTYEFTNNLWTSWHINGDFRADQQVGYRSVSMQLNPHGADRSTDWWADGSKANGWMPTQNSKTLVSGVNAQSPWGSNDKDMAVLAKRTARRYSEGPSRNEFNIEFLVNWDTDSLLYPTNRLGLSAGVSATKVPQVAFTLWREELERGMANHMLWMSIHNAVAGSFDWPAKASDGSSDAGSFRQATYTKQGMVLRLKRSFNVEAATTHEGLRAILRTAKVHGVFIGDKNGLDDAEFATIYGDPAFDGRTWPSTSVVQWSDFEVVNFTQVMVASNSMQAVF